MKKFVAFLLMVSMVSVLGITTVGCGGKDAPKKQDTPKKEEPKK